LFSFQSLLLLRREERWPVFSGCAAGFAVLGAYYLLKPLRDEVFVGDRAVGAELWTGTFLLALLLHPVYGMLLARVHRERVLPILFRAAALLLVGLYWLLHRVPDPETVGPWQEQAGSFWSGRWVQGEQGWQLLQGSRIWLQRAFYVSVSVFNLYLISALWSALIERFEGPPARRLFGLLAAGGSLGAIAGSALVAVAFDSWGSGPFLLLAAGLLEFSLHALRSAGACQSRAPMHGSSFEGLGLVLRHPRLRLLGVYILLFTLGSTWLYFLTADLLQVHLPDEGDRVRFFSGVHLVTNVLTLGMQIGLVGRLMSSRGLLPGLVLLPLVSLVGFSALALAPLLSVLFAFNVLRASSRYALAKPAREALYVGLEPRDVYKAKNFLDAALYRGGDLVSGWAFQGASALIVSGGAALTLLVLPFMATSVGVAWRLGRQADESQG